MTENQDPASARAAFSTPVRESSSTTRFLRSSHRHAFSATTQSSRQLRTVEKENHCKSTSSSSTTTASSTAPPGSSKLLRRLLQTSDRRRLLQAGAVVLRPSPSPPTTASSSSSFFSSLPLLKPATTTSSSSSSITKAALVKPQPQKSNAPTTMDKTLAAFKLVSVQCDHDDDDDTSRDSSLCLESDHHHHLSCSPNNPEQLQMRSQRLFDHDHDDDGNLRNHSIGRSSLSPLVSIRKPGIPPTISTTTATADNRDDMDLDADLNSLWTENDNERTMMHHHPDTEEARRDCTNPMSWTLWNEEEGGLDAGHIRIVPSSSSCHGSPCEEQEEESPATVRAMSPPRCILRPLPKRLSSKAL